MENNQPSGVSVGERVWGAAEAAGAERRKRIDTTINRVLGLPEAAKKLVEIGSDDAKAKAREIEQRAIDLKDRTGAKITETADKLVKRYESTRDNVKERVSTFVKETTAKAVDLGKRAQKAGLETGLKIEDRIVKICEFPAVIREAMAKKQEGKAGSLEKQRAETLAAQFAEKNGLAEEQRLALEEFMAEQLAQKEMMAQEHKEVETDLKGQVEAARARSQELKSGADTLRAKIEKKRFIKGLLARITK
jgi:hypothetical protein